MWLSIANDLSSTTSTINEIMAFIVHHAILGIMLGVIFEILGKIKNKF